MPRGGGAGEREGSPSAAWSSAASVRRVQVGGALPHNSGERRGRRDSVDVADRWAGARWGPGRQCLGAAWGSVVRWSERR
jgi:hypothetical protein